MKKYLIILLIAMLPTLALAQQAGGHITRPSKPATTTTKPPKKQAPPKKQTTPKPPKKQSHSQPVGTGRALSEEPRPQTSVRTDAAGNKIYTIGNVSFTMVAVEGGTFTMGATSEQGSDAFRDEKPAHSVTLSSYYIGQTEVTQELWQAVMGSNPSKFKGVYKPVEQVSYDDCQQFINRLNSLTGEQFKLPTEAQWEYAARGGKHSRAYKYSGSNSINDIAWYEENSYKKGENSPDYGTHNVALKQPNELGIYDLSGNVWEWCRDWYGDYSSGSQTDPTGPATGSYRVDRGGSWINDARDCRVSFRDRSWPGNRNSPGNRNYNLGLRLAL